MNVYEIVTSRILKEMEQGVIPWHKPWMDVRSGAYNRISKKSYSLLNQMLLSRQGEYATFRQWTSLGSRIKKGAKSEMVVFWKLLTSTSTDDEGELITKKTPLLRYYNVFHVTDVDGVEPLKAEQLYDTLPDSDAEEVLQDYVQREGITLETELSNRAYYSPSSDVIHLPEIGQYENASDYYSVAFHEATHSTQYRSCLASCKIYRQRKRGSLWL